MVTMTVAITLATVIISRRNSTYWRHLPAPGTYWTGITPGSPHTSQSGRCHGVPRVSHLPEATQPGAMSRGLRHPTIPEHKPSISRIPWIFLCVPPGLAWLLPPGVTRVTRDLDKDTAWERVSSLQHILNPILFFPRLAELSEFLKVVLHPGTITQYQRKAFPWPRYGWESGKQAHAVHNSMYFYCCVSRPPLCLCVWGYGETQCHPPDTTLRTFPHKYSLMHY